VRRRDLQSEDIDALEIEFATIQGDIGALPLNGRGVGHCIYRKKKTVRKLHAKKQRKDFVLGE
jgi:hypothetical protein